MSLTPAQKKYYIECMKESFAIAADAFDLRNWQDAGTIVAAVFEKIASPLFYVSAGEEEKQEPAPAPQPQEKASPEREKRIAELKAMGYRETKNPDVFMLRSAEGAPAFIDIKTGRTWRGIK